MSEVATLQDLLTLLQRLKDAGVYYVISDPTEGAVMIEAAVPGQRWEIELHAHGQVSVEVFVSTNGVQGPKVLDALLEQFGSDR